MREGGWAPVAAVEQRIRLEERRGFQKHFHFDTLFPTVSHDSVVPNTRAPGCALAHDYCVVASARGTLFAAFGPNFTSLAMLAECWLRRCP